MAVQTVIGLRAALCFVVVMILMPVAGAIAEEPLAAITGGGIARPSIEELVIPSDENKVGV